MNRTFPAVIFDVPLHALRRNEVLAAPEAKAAKVKPFRNVHSRLLPWDCIAGLRLTGLSRRVISHSARPRYAWIICDRSICSTVSTTKRTRCRYSACRIHTRRVTERATARALRQQRKLRLVSSTERNDQDVRRRSTFRPKSPLRMLQVVDANGAPGRS